VTDVQGYWQRRIEAGNALLTQQPNNRAAQETVMASLRCLLADLLDDQAHATEARQGIAAALGQLDLSLVTPGLRLSFVNLIIDMLNTLGHVSEALAYSERFLPLDAPAVEPAAVCIVRYQGDFLRQMGRGMEARARQQAAREAAVSQGLPLEEAQCLNNLALLDMEAGNLAGASQQLARALARADGAPAPVLLGHVHNNRGIIASITGDLETARSEFTRSLAHREAGGDWPGTAETLYNLALVSRRQQRLNEALTLLDQAHALARHLRYGMLLAHIMVARAELFIEQNDLDPAEPLLRRAQTFYSSQQIQMGVAETIRVRGDSLLAANQHDHAIPLFRLAADLCRQAGYALGEAMALERLSEAIARTGDLSAAYQTVSAAASLFRQSGAQLDASRAEAAQLALQLRQ